MYLAPYGYTTDLPAEYDEMVRGKIENELIFKRVIISFILLVSCHDYLCQCTHRYLRHPVYLWKHGGHHLLV